MTVPSEVLVALLSLTFLAPVDQVNGQATGDTIAIATLVGKAIKQETTGAPGIYMVDTSAVGARYSLVALQASGLRARLVSRSTVPICRFHPTKDDPDSLYLFSLIIETMTRTHAVVSSAVVCDNGPMRGYWARVRYELRARNGHWRLLPGRRVTVT